MNNSQRLSHTKWNANIISYLLSNSEDWQFKLKEDIGKILRQLCDWKK